MEIFYSILLLLGLKTISFGQEQASPYFEILEKVK